MHSGSGCPRNAEPEFEDRLEVVVDREIRRDALGELMRTIEQGVAGAARSCP